MQITEERKKRIIDLYFNQHKTYAEIAEIERILPRDIHTIIKTEEARRQHIDIRNNDKSCLPEPTNYFLRVRQLLKLPSY